MARLRLAAVATLLSLASPVGAQVGRWAPAISEASQRFGIPEDWIRRLMSAESGGRLELAGRPAVSRAGAMGLMQLMPGAWADMRAAHGLGNDPFDPHDNIIAGAAYLRLMYDRFGYPGLFAAYNAGPGRYASHLATGQPLPPETRAYAAKLGGAMNGEPHSRMAESPSALFALRPIAAAMPIAPRETSAPSRDVLFAIRR